MAWLRPVEAARVMGVSRSFVYKLVKSGELPSDRCHRRILIPVEALSKSFKQRDGVLHEPEKAGRGRGPGDGDDGGRRDVQGPAR